MKNRHLKSLLGTLPLTSPKIHYDSSIGIYHIKCVPLDRYYVGQSKNVPSRIRNHKMNLKNGTYGGKNKGLSQMQQDYDAMPEGSFVFAQICSCEEDDLYEMETFWAKSYVNNGFEVYNYFLNTEVTGLVCPDAFREIVKRVITALDKGKLSPSELESSLDHIETYR